MKKIILSRSKTEVFVMKKIILLFFAAILLSSLFACTPANPSSDTEKNTELSGGAYVPSKVIGYNDTLQRNIYETSRPAEDHIDEYTLCEGDGKVGRDVILYQGVLYNQITSTFEDFDGYTFVGKTAAPSYPWVTPTRELGTNCLPEGVAVYRKEVEGETVLAVHYRDMNPFRSETEDCLKLFRPMKTGG